MKYTNQNIGQALDDWIQQYGGPNLSLEARQAIQPIRAYLWSLVTPGTQSGTGGAPTKIKV